MVMMPYPCTVGSWTVRIHPNPKWPQIPTCSWHNKDTADRKIFWDSAEVSHTVNTHFLPIIPKSRYRHTSFVDVGFDQPLCNPRYGIIASLFSFFSSPPCACSAWIPIWMWSIPIMSWETTQSVMLCRCWKNGVGECDSIRLMPTWGSMLGRYSFTTILVILFVCSCCWEGVGGALGLRMYMILTANAMLLEGRLLQNFRMSEVDRMMGHLHIWRDSFVFGSLPFDGINLKIAVLVCPLYREMFLFPFPSTVLGEYFCWFDCGCIWYCRCRWCCCHHHHCPKQ